MRISELMRRLLFERPCTSKSLCRWSSQAKDFTNVYNQTRKLIISGATPFLTSTLVMPQFIGTSAQKFRLRLYHTVVNIVVILLRLLVHLLGHLLVHLLVYLFVKLLDHILVHLLVELLVHLLEQLFSQLSLLLLIRSLLGSAFGRPTCLFVLFHQQ